MAENTKIEWATHTFNPFIGCTKVSPGCDNCYAEAMMDHRYHRVQWGPHGERVRTSVEYWKQPFRWARKAREALQDYNEGMLTSRPPRPRVFCASLADVFDNQVPTAWRIDLLELIRRTPELDWLLLTKRPENINRLMLEAIGALTIWRIHFPNVWLGFTAEDQEHFDRRWPIVRDIPAAVRFCSYEPAIGPLRLPSSLHEIGTPKLDWLICGGESGIGYRPMREVWEEDIRRDCERTGTAYFFKQRSGKLPIPPGFPVVRQFPRERNMVSQ